MAFTPTATVFFFTLVAVGSAMPKNGTLFECTSEGRFPDPFDCSAFFTCVAKSDGSLVRNKGDCKGFAFHPDLRTCVDPTKVPGCNSRKPKQLRSDPTLAGICDTSGFICGDCKTVVNCIETTGYQDTKCADGSTCFVPAEGGLAGTAACLTEDRVDEGCKCTEMDINKPKVDPYSTAGFIFCPPNDGEVQVHKCPVGLTYAADDKQCLSADGSPTCTAPGTFTNTDCSGTYSCLQTSSGFVRSALRCPEGEMINPKDGTCSDPCGWEKKDHTCNAEGRFKFATDCTKFVVCVGTEASGYEKTIRQCPSGYIWNQTQDNKGLCAAESDTVVCSELPDHSCPVATVPCPVSSFRSRIPDETENTIQNVIQILQEQQE